MPCYGALFEDDKNMEHQNMPDKISQGCTNSCLQLVVCMVEFFEYILVACDKIRGMNFEWVIRGLCICELERER